MPPSASVPPHPGMYHDRPSWIDCRRAARSVRGAEHGAEALDTVRPRGVAALIRTSAPLALLLYIAGRDGRLVWRDAEMFALLRPPAGQVPSQTVPLRFAALRLLDRQWDGFVLFTPPVTAVALAALLGGIAGAAGHPAAAVAGLLLLVAALLYIAILMTLMLAMNVVRSYRDFRLPPRPADVTLSAFLPGRRWSMVLCHLTQPERADELLRAVDRHLARLIAIRLRRSADDLGAGLQGTSTMETLVCLAAGITTTAMRERVARWSGGDVADAATLRVAAKAARQPFRPFDKGGFAFWFLGGLIVTVLVTATLVPGWEQQACGDDCAGRPVTYLAALRWLTQRLFFTDPPGLTPASNQARVVGWFFSLLTPSTVAVLAAAVLRYRRVRNTELRRNEEALDRLHCATTVLLLVATAIERTAVLAAVRRITRAEPEVQFVQSQVVFRLGRISNADIVLVQTGPGSTGPSAAAITAAALIQSVVPDYIILTGLCFGLRPREQKLGDVVVSSQMRAIDSRKVADVAPGQPPTIMIRGDLVSASSRLHNSFAALAFDFPHTGMAVHYGTMLSSSTLVNSQQLVDELLRIDPEAMGGEMEGAGVYAAAAPEKTDWIIVKSICDWGHGKTDDAQALAAANAAAFVVHVIGHGAVDETPTTAAQRR